MGFCTTCNMPLADAYVGWIDANGMPVVYDSYMPDYNQPRLDTQLGGTEDATAINGSQSNGMTTLTFTRLLDTGDKYDQVRAGAARRVRGPR